MESVDPYKLKESMSFLKRLIEIEMPICILLKTKCISHPIQYITFVATGGMFAGTHTGMPLL